MTYSLEEIEDMLDELPGQKFRFDKVQEDALTYTGALRTEEGQNVVEPAAESSSMIVALKPTVDFLVAAPEIIRQLLDTIEYNASTTSMIAPQPDVDEEDVKEEAEIKAEKPKKAASQANTPISL